MSGGSRRTLASVHTVVVERKPQKRVFAQPGAKPDAAAAKPGVPGAVARTPAQGAAAAKPAVRTASPAAGKNLSTGELDKRAQAVLVERKRAEEEAQRRAAEDAILRQRAEAEAKLKAEEGARLAPLAPAEDRKSTRLNSSHRT